MKFATLVMFAAAVWAQPAKDTEKLAPYYPTPESVVQKMIELGGLKKGEKMFDLGSGDGRIVVMAAQKFGADATGIEFDEDLYKRSGELADDAARRLSEKYRELYQRSKELADEAAVVIRRASNTVGR